MDCVVRSLIAHPNYPQIIPNFFSGQEVYHPDDLLNKLDPESGETLCRFARSEIADTSFECQPSETWSRISPVTLGAKNPLIVCKDVDLDKADNWPTLLAFSNAGQRTASGSGVIVFNSVFETFRERLIERMNVLRVGIAIVNGSTHGSEPHMPCRGYGFSGNRCRESDLGALDSYSTVKSKYTQINPEEI